MKSVSRQETFGLAKILAKKYKVEIRLLRWIATFPPGKVISVFERLGLPSEKAIDINVNCTINPLSPNSDEIEISLYIITTCSNVQVMRIKKVITKDEMS